MKKDDILNAELIKRIKLGDPFAFKLLFKLTHKQLCNYAFIYVKSFEIADDIVQETFIKIWETRDNLREEYSVRSFLFRCVHNYCINHLKKDRVINRRTEEYAIDLITSMATPDPDVNKELYEKLALEEVESQIAQAIDSLPVQCKEIFLLCRFNSLTYPEIGQKLGVSVNTVKTQISRALQKIRSELKKF